MEVPPLDIVTRDNVTVFKVNAVVTLRVVDPTMAVIEVASYIYQTSQFSQTTPSLCPARSSSASCSLIVTASTSASRTSSTGTPLLRVSRLRRGRCGRLPRDHASRHGPAGRSRA